MTTPTILVNGVTFTFNQGDVARVKSSISTSIDNTPIKGGPMAAYNYDNDGTSKRITIEGRLTEASSSRTSSGSTLTILAQKQWLECLANGDQTSITLNTTYEQSSASGRAGAVSPRQAALVTTQCVVASMEFDEVEGKVNELPFIITFVVGTKF